MLTYLFSPITPGLHGRVIATHVIKVTPGITWFAVTRISDIKTRFDPFMPLSFFEGKKKSMATFGMALMRIPGCL